MKIFMDVDNQSCLFIIICVKKNKQTNKTWYTSSVTVNIFYLDSFTERESFSLYFGKKHRKKKRYSIKYLMLSDKLPGTRKLFLVLRKRSVLTLIFWFANKNRSIFIYWCSTECLARIFQEPGKESTWMVVINVFVNLQNEGAGVKYISISIKWWLFFFFLFRFCGIVDQKCNLPS